MTIGEFPLGLTCCETQVRSVRALSWARARRRSSPSTPRPADETVGTVREPGGPMRGMEGVCVDPYSWVRRGVVGASLGR